MPVSLPIYYPFSAYSKKESEFAEWINKKKASPSLIQCYALGKEDREGMVMLFASPFDSEVLGLQTLRCDVIVPPGCGKRVRTILSRALRFARRKGYKFIFTRLPAEAVDVIQMASELGFFITEVMLTFRRKPRYFTVQDVEPFQKKDLPFVTSLGSLYPYHRFANDPFIPKQRGQAIYDRWMAANAAGRVPVIWIAKSKGKPCGYLAEGIFHIGSKSIAFIDLVAVHPRFQRQGIATKLVQKAIGWAAKKCDDIQVGTIAENKAAISLYQKLGFSYGYAQVTLHLHLK